MAIAIVVIASIEAHFETDRMTYNPNIIRKAYIHIIQVNIYPSGIQTIGENPTGLNGGMCQQTFLRSALHTLQNKK